MGRTVSPSPPRTRRKPSPKPSSDNEDKNPLRPTSREVTKAIIKVFRSNKAPGPDGITYRAFKHARRKFVMHMTNICNAILRLALPISMEASRRSHGHQARTVRQLVAELPTHQPSLGHGLKKAPVGIHRSGFLDITKAFDKVWHQGLLLKMHRIGIPKATVRLVKLEGQRSTVSRSAARLSDLTPTVQHLHLRHSSNRARQTGDVRGRRLHLHKILGRADNRPPSTLCRPGTQSGESSSIQGKARPWFSREAVAEEESTATQLNLPSKGASSPSDLRSNTWGSYWIPE
ncbi:hypothetical protein Trydic_g7738 [Trypoxylus dichotomus]